MRTGFTSGKHHPGGAGCVIDGEILFRLEAWSRLLAFDISGATSLLQPREVTSSAGAAVGLAASGTSSVALEPNRDCLGLPYTCSSSESALGPMHPKRRRPALPAHLPPQRARDLRSGSPGARGGPGPAAALASAFLGARPPAGPEARARFGSLAVMTVAFAPGRADGPDGIWRRRSPSSTLWGISSGAALAVSVGAPRGADAACAASACSAGCRGSC